MIRGYWVAVKLLPYVHFFKPFSRRPLCHKTKIDFVVYPGRIVTPRDVPDVPEFCASCRALSKRKPRKPHSDG